MLSAEDNELLTRTGPGTAMGELFRRFWVPVLLSRELPEPDGPPVRVTVMGEDLIAFRDTRRPRRPGRAPLPAPRRQPVLRPQRGVRHPLRLPRLEVRRRRPAASTCRRWRRDERICDTGSALTAYPTREWGEFVWAYLGPPEHEPPLPELEFALRAARAPLRLQEAAAVQLGAVVRRARSTPRTSRSCTRRCRCRRPTRASSRARPMASAMRWMKDDPMPVFHVVEHDAGPAPGRVAPRRRRRALLADHPVPDAEPQPGAGCRSRPTRLRPDLGADRRPQLLGLRLQLEPRPPADATSERFIPGVPSVHAEVDEHWVPIRNRANDYLIDREAQKHADASPASRASPSRTRPSRTARASSPTARASTSARPTSASSGSGVSCWMPPASLARGTEPAAAAAPHAYRVRSGGTVAPAAQPVADVLTERFGTQTGLVV